jgi:hypothetical protein
MHIASALAIAISLAVFLYFIWVMSHPEVD